jgi:hypothetical protein
VLLGSYCWLHSRRKGTGFGLGLVVLAGVSPFALLLYSQKEKQKEKSSRKKKKQQMDMNTKKGKGRRGTKHLVVNQSANSGRKQKQDRRVRPHSWAAPIVKHEASFTMNLTFVNHEANFILNLNVRKSRGELDPEPKRS